VERPLLMAVPNVSEGRDGTLIAEVAAAFLSAQAAVGAPSEDEHARGDPVRLLDVHSDGDHHRSVYTLAGRQGQLADALVSGASRAVASIDVVVRGDVDGARAGQHPHVGAVDVVPVVYLEEAARGAACAEALLVGDRLAEELGLPVFLYGELTADEPSLRRTRAELRRGGVQRLAARMAGEADEAPLGPDFGPGAIHPTAGATLVAARPPLVAFNLQLAAPATLETAREIAALIREGGPEGLPGVRAIGVGLGGGIPQVSTNVERPFEVPLALVVEAVARHAAVHSVELVGLAPSAALAGFPDEIPFPDFDPARHVIENALRW
jgi:glutamate formiminotransferase/glutamate formiminotransferase/formiminotetrahydrofolate cyclodeaminase